MTRQPFCETLEISLGVTTCSGLTTFSEVTNSLKVRFLLGETVFLAEVACFAGSTYVKGTNTEDTSMKVLVSELLIPKVLVLGMHQLVLAVLVL